ncbi:hypothetical protein EV1_006831 [Malus domestica]
MKLRSSMGGTHMELPPLPRSPKPNPTSSFSSVDSEVRLKSIDQVCKRLNYETGVAEYRNYKLMKAEKELMDLNGEANEAFYRASKQKTNADTSGERITFLNFELFQKRRGHIESYERSREGNAQMKEERNKDFEDSRRLVKERNRVNHNGITWHFIVVLANRRKETSYLQKFVLMFVGGTLGGYLFICEKVSAALPFLDLHTDPGRTAVGLHLDPEALNWCMENDINKAARRNISLTVNRDGLESGGLKSTLEEDSSSSHHEKSLRNHLLPARGLCVLLTTAVVVSINVLNWFCISSMFLMPCQRKGNLKNRWSLPEIKDYLEEAGFKSVHFWLRKMEDSREIRRADGLGVGRDIKYEEAKHFQQHGSWNADIVGVALLHAPGKLCVEVGLNMCIWLLVTVNCEVVYLLLASNYSIIKT